MLIRTVVALDEGQALTTLSNHLAHSLCCSQLCGLQRVSSPLWASVSSLGKWRQKEEVSVVLNTGPQQTLTTICDFPSVSLVLHVVEKMDNVHPSPSPPKFPEDKESGRTQPAANHGFQHGTSGPPTLHICLPPLKTVLVQEKIFASSPNLVMGKLGEFRISHGIIWVRPIGQHGRMSLAPSF